MFLYEVSSCENISACNTSIVNLQYIIENLCNMLVLFEEIWYNITKTLGGKNMALIKCPECGRENVSDKAEMCPDCGYGIKAHFEEIEREKEAERKKLEEEKEMKELQKWKEEREQAELDTIKMPSKPNLGKILLEKSILPLVFIVCCVPALFVGIFVSINYASS